MNNSKLISFKRKLPWLIPILVAVAILIFSVAPESSAYAEGPDVYKIKFQMQVGEYGNLVFPYVVVEDVDENSELRLYGNLLEDEKTFESCSIKDKDTAKYYVKISDIKAKIGSSPTVYDFIDDSGLIIASPGTYSLQLSYENENGATKDSFILYRKEDGKRIAAIEDFAGGDQGKFTVRQMTVEVVLDDTKIADFVTEEEGVTIIERVYGDDPLSIAFKAKNPLPFGHQMSSEVNISGNTSSSPVGTYDITVSNEAVSILDGETSMNAYYRIECNQIIKINVNKLVLTAPAYDEPNYYSDETVTRNDFFAVVSTPFDLTRKADVLKSDNEHVHPGWKANFSYKLIVSESDLDNERIKVTGEGSYLYYNVTLVSVKNGETELDGNNFELNFSSEMKEEYRTSISKRHVYICIEGNTSGVYGVGDAIEIEPEAFSQTYGAAYSRMNSLPIKIQNTDVIVEFEIDGFDDLIDDTSVLQIEDDEEVKLILNVGTYPIKNPFVKDDNRYEIEFDKNTFYTVTKKEVSAKDIIDSEANLTEVIHYEENYIFARFDYQTTDLDELSYTFLFIDYDVATEPTVTLTASIVLTEEIPGYYSASSCGSQNYKVTDAEVLGVLINKIKLSVNFDSNVKYDRSPVIPTLSGGLDELEYDYELKFSTGATYSEKAKLDAAPIDRGDYSFIFTLNKGNDYYEFESGESFSATFTIKPRPVYVKVVFEKNYKVFGETVKINDVAYYNVFYYQGEITDEEGVLAGDEFGELKFNGNADAKTAMPRDYTLGNHFTNLNYEIKKVEYFLKDGKKTSNSFHVYKLPVGTFESLKVAVIDVKKVTLTESSITLPSLSIYGVELDALCISYCKKGESEYKTSDSLTASDLEEGTTYNVRYSLKKNNALVDINAEYFGAAKSITTNLSKPVISQYPALTTASSISVEIVNYDAENSYKYSIDGNEAVSVNNDEIKLIEITDGENAAEIKAILIINALQPASDDEDAVPFEPSTEYTIILYRTTADATAASRDIKANTADTMPMLEKANLEISSSAIVAKLPQELIDEDAKIAYEYIMVTSGHITYGSLSDTDSSELAAYFKKNANEVVYGEGKEILNLSPNSIYYVKYYVLGDETNNYVQSESIYFELHTAAITEEPNKAQGILATISKYLLVSAIGVFLVLFIITAIKFHAIKKKYRRA